MAGRAWGIATRGQIYMGAPIAVVEIHLQAKLLPPSPTSVWSATASICDVIKYINQYEINILIY